MAFHSNNPVPVAPINAGDLSPEHDVRAFYDSDQESRPTCRCDDSDSEPCTSAGDDIGSLIKQLLKGLPAKMQESVKQLYKEAQGKLHKRLPTETEEDFRVRVLEELLEKHPHLHRGLDAVRASLEKLIGKSSQNRGTTRGFHHHDERPYYNPHPFMPSGSATVSDEESTSRLERFKVQRPAVEVVAQPDEDATSKASDKSRA